jgi:hypothetical protein
MSESSDITFRRLVAEDAAALSRCFERCYGRSYVVADFYDAAALAARLRDGTLRSIVAVAASGEIVGHMGLTIRNPEDRTVDAGNSVVDPDYRGRQIVAQLGAGVVALCREGGFLGFHHYPTTVHPIMQKLAVASGGIESGILLAYIPSGTEYREIEGGVRQDRPAVVVVYQPLAPTPPREVFVPRELAEPIGAIYARGELPRTMRVATDALPAVATRLVSSADRRRGSLRIAVEQVGADLGERVAAAVAGSEASVSQVDLRMADSSLGAAVDALRASGFFFAAVLPEYRDGDVLRLQRLAPRDVAAPELVTDDARELLRAILADRARAE